MSLEHELRVELKRLAEIDRVFEDDIEEVLAAILDVFRREVDAQPPDQGTQRLEPSS